MGFRAATITIKRASSAKNGQAVGRIGAEGVIRRLDEPSASAMLSLVDGCHAKANFLRKTIMNLTASRATLIANICALVVAFIVVAEGAYIGPGALGHYLSNDAWGFFCPVLVMFIIRNRSFSFCFLALYVLLSIQMLFQARGTYLGTYVENDPKFGSLPFLPLFAVFSLVCLMIYAAFASVRFAIAKLSSTRN
jgi:hypothetical protein